MIALLVLTTLVVFVAVDLALRLGRSSATTPDIQPARPMRPHTSPGLFTDSGHTWTELLPSGRVRVGIDDFVGRAAGMVDRILPRQEGERVRRGEPLVIVERGNCRLTVPAPLSGVIESSDDRLDAGGGVPSDRCLCTMKPTSLGQELRGLRIDQGARQWLDAEVQRLAAWAGAAAAPVAGATLQDGGEPVEGLLQHLQSSAWQDFERCFLHRGRDT